MYEYSENYTTRKNETYELKIKYTLTPTAWRGYLVRKSDGAITRFIPAQLYGEHNISQISPSFDDFPTTGMYRGDSTRHWSKETMMMHLRYLCEQK